MSMGVMSWFSSSQWFSILPTG